MSRLIHQVAADEPSFALLQQTLWQEATLRHPWYSPLSAAYQREYLRDCCFIDRSFVVAEGDRPILGVPMALCVAPDGLPEISAFGYPTLSLESRESAKIEPGLRVTAARLLKAEIDRVIEMHQVQRVIHREWSGALTPMGHHLMEIGGKATPLFSQWIDLTLPQPVLRQQVRKSYQSLINWGEKNLCLHLIDAHWHSQAAYPEAMERFRLLHIHAAGRETRSAQSWQCQFDMVQAGEAFLILGEWEGDLVTAALFQYTPDLCYYGVSASRRELFEKPLSHAVLWRAIVHAKALGCRWFEMGEQRYPNQGEPLPTSKEHGISTFKRGFGGETRLMLNIHWHRTPEEKNEEGKERE